MIPSLKTSYNMLTSIDVKFILDGACLPANLGDKGLFRSVNMSSACCSCYVFSQ